MKIRSGAAIKDWPQTVTNSQTVKQFLTAAALKEFRTVRFFVEEIGLHPDETKSDSPTALCYAVLLRDRCLMQYLLLKGADVNKPDQRGMTPLHYAAFGGCKFCILYLLQSGADVNQVNQEGKTALALCAGRADLTASRNLLKRYEAVLTKPKKSSSYVH